MAGSLKRHGLCYLLLLCCLTACSGGHYRAPVDDRQIRSRPVPATYSVQKGDTLYSIAWRYGLDYRTVARANRISSPYKIYPGQRLDLLRKTPLPARTVAARAPATPAARSAPATSTSGRVPAPVTQTAPRSPSKTVAAPVTARAAAPAPASKAPPVTKPSSSARKVTVPATSGSSATAWRWPTAGSVSRGYSSSVHKGVDITGSRGDAIKAVAAGTVVYAGAGIVGYGELLIVKHNETYLSAYGHNERLLVAEGERVSGGQKIATKGSSGTDTVKLHFEIRRNGKPVDPLGILPKR